MSGDIPEYNIDLPSDDAQEPVSDGLLDYDENPYHLYYDSGAIDGDPVVVPQEPDIDTCWIPEDTIEPQLAETAEAGAAVLPTPELEYSGDEQSEGDVAADPRDTSPRLMGGDESEVPRNEAAVPVSTQAVRSPEQPVAYPGEYVQNNTSEAVGDDFGATQAASDHTDTPEDGPRESAADDTPPERAVSPDGPSGPKPPDRPTSGDESPEEPGDKGRTRHQVANVLILEVATSPEWSGEESGKVDETLGNLAEAGILLAGRSGSNEDVLNVVQQCQRLYDQLAVPSSEVGIRMLYAGTQLGDRDAEIALRVLLEREQLDVQNREINLLGVMPRQEGLQQQLLNTLVVECERLGQSADSWIQRYNAGPVSQWQLDVAHYVRCSQGKDEAARAGLGAKIIEFLAGDWGFFPPGVVITEAAGLLEVCEDPALQRGIMRKFIEAQNILLHPDPDRADYGRPTMNTFLGLLQIAERVLPKAEIDFSNLWSIVGPEAIADRSGLEMQMTEMPHILALDELIRATASFLLAPPPPGGTPSPSVDKTDIEETRAAWDYMMRIHFGAGHRDILRDIESSGPGYWERLLPVAVLQYVREEKFRAAQELLGLCFAPTIYQGYWRDTDDIKKIVAMRPNALHISHYPYLKVLFENAQAIASKDPDRLIERITAMAELVGPKPDESGERLVAVPDSYDLEQYTVDVRRALAVLGEVDQANLHHHMRTLLPILRRAEFPLEIFADVLGAIAENSNRDMLEEMRKAFGVWPDENGNVALYRTKLAVYLSRLL